MIEQDAKIHNLKTQLLSQLFMWMTAIGGEKIVGPYE